MIRIEMILVVLLVTGMEAFFLKKIFSFHLVLSFAHSTLFHKSLHRRSV